MAQVAGLAIFSATPATLGPGKSTITVVGAVMAEPSAFFVGAVSVAGLTVGLTVELLVVSELPRQQPETVGSVGSQCTLT